MSRWRSVRSAIVAALLTLAAGAAAVGQESSVDRPEILARQQQTVFRAALRTVAPSIVRIDTIGGALPVKRAADDAGRSRTAPGFRQADGPTTGLIWSADGYIITSSFNFVRDPTVITATLADGRRFVARLVARDHPARLALLKIDADDLPTPRWAESSELRPGQWTLAAGYGFGGGEPAVSVGVLSALGRMSGRALQTDARLSPAHYGGPLFDIEGRVVGVCAPMGPGDDELASVQWYDSGIGFAVHRDHIIRYMPRMLRGEDLHRGLLGISLDLRRPVVGVEFEGVAGVRIVGEPRGPAAQAGLLADDVITHIDGAPTPRIVDFKRVVARKAAGDEIVVRYRRADKEAETSCTLTTADALRTPKPDAPK